MIHPPPAKDKTSSSPSRIISTDNRDTTDYISETLLRNPPSCAGSKSAAMSSETGRPRAASPRTRPSRQQPPVSCQSCRTRKLRCNREQPCSNCVSRGIPCTRTGARRPQTASTPAPEVTVTTESPVSQQQSKAQVLRRLSRLEEIIAFQSERWNQSAPAATQLEAVSSGTPDPTSFLAPYSPGISISAARSQSLPVNSYMEWLQQLTPASGSVVRSSHPVQD